jgi:hypothetical protein
MASSGELPGADLAGSFYPSADVAGSFLEVTEWPGHDAAELFEDADRTIAALRNQVEVLAALAGRPNTGLAQTAAVAVQSLARRRTSVRALALAKIAAVRLQAAARRRAARRLADVRRVATRAELVPVVRIQRAVRAFFAADERQTKAKLRRRIVRQQATIERLAAAHVKVADRARAAESDAASSRRSCEELAEKLKVLAAEKFALKRALQEANAREAELGKHLDAELAMRLQMEETAKAK